MTFYSLVTNIAPILLRGLITHIQQGDFQTGINVFILLILLKCVELFAQSLSQYISDMTVIRASRDVRIAVFTHLHKLDFFYHSNKSSGKLISNFKRGESAFITFYEEINVWGLKTILDFIFMIIILSQLYQSLILYFIIIFIFNAIVMYFTVRFNISERKKFNDIEDDVMMITVDNMVAFDTVKYFSNEVFEQNRLRKVMEAWVHGFIRYVKSFRYIDVLNGGILSMGFVGMVGIAMFDLIHGTIQIGDFILVITLGGTFFAGMRDLVYRIRTLAKCHADLEEYILILEEDIVVKDYVKPEEQKKWRKILLDTKEGLDVTFDSVSFSYPNRPETLTAINLAIKKNQSIAFVGTSGVGKTTMTKLLMRFYDINQGEIRISGVPIQDISKEELRKAIGIVPQETVLFNESIGYNIAYGDNTKSEKELWDAINMANLGSFIQSLPKGLKTKVGERGIKLSGGQKQRLAIARAFMKDAPIIIFDEATSSLDSESERLIQKSLWKLAKNRTTIIIAHRLSTIKKVDRIVVFDKGGIVEEGTHEELQKKESGIYKYLWELQSKGDIA